MDYKRRIIHLERASRKAGRRWSLLQGGEEQELIDIRDIVQIKDASDTDMFVSDVLIGSIMENKLFKLFLITVITLNCITIGFQTNDVIAKNGWNIVDGVVTLALIIGPMMAKSGANVLVIIRVLRVLRSVRGFACLQSLSVIVHVIMQSIPDMATIFFLLGIIMLVFALFGVTLFSAAVPSAFGDLPSALYTLFICITQDGWMAIYRDF